MRLPFRKMHGLGNDFVVVDARDRPTGLTEEAIRLIGDRHRGVGFDQLVTLERDAAGADLFIRFHNSDGSEAGACGNGTRCAAALVLDETGRNRLSIRTAGGTLAAERLPGGLFRVDMGAPRLDWRDVPLARPCDTLHVPMAAEGVRGGVACSMGNPHVTFFVDDLDTLEIGRIGPLLERDPWLPDRGNIGFAQMLGRDRMRLVVWERGAGLTLACGSGACAAAVNAHRRGLADRAVTIEMPGGELRLEWRESDGHVLMAGPVATAFSGEIALG
ncbi:diaminopimelate epimerase [Sabulicella glaciei]|uniref:Diaminopimelate epimerase n=1 Tax=Sabulicella glaciei TaxID=2984948 RepID=A0ABT3NUL0_9PROT|nr:diaminopimelate epimerase [Roseococcus sp. MDT2-1-1]MCW8085843.1 diaminopimelate epimerase [Roseococcus sp. MDT2-1-1]